MSERKKWYLVLGVAGVLGVLLGAVGIAYAQSPQPPVDVQPFSGPGRCPGGGFFGARPVSGDALQSLVAITAELTGLGEDEVIDALGDGQTVAQIAEAAGVDPQEIVQAAIVEAESRLGEGLESGRLTQTQMDRALERLSEELPERLEQPWRRAGPRDGIFGHFGEGFWTMYDAVAEALGLTPEELFAELHGGKTVAEVAEGQGVEMEDVRDALQAARGDLMEEAIEQAVENGRITEERADWLLEGLEKGFLPRGRGFRPGRGGRGRGMGW